MSIVGSNALAGASGQAGGAAAGFQIDRSLRFNSADSAYLNRTPSSAGNRRTFTWSGWVKRTVLGADKFIFSAGSDPANFHYLRFKSNDTLEATEKISDSVQSSLITSAVFRDPSAWMHIIYVYDSSQATAADRLSLYVNGAKVTAFSTSTYPSQNHDSYINSTSNHFINARPNPAGYADAYLAEIYLLDGTAVSDATDFGEYDSNNVWQPKAYSGSYGTNGFKLDFSDNTSTTTIAEDSSGNNNDWTANNISVAAGAGNDSLIDTPTNYTASPNNGGNYCTLNPLDKNTLTLANGNLKVTGTTVNQSVRGTIFVSSGKWYYEATVTNVGTETFVGFAGGSYAFGGSTGRAVWRGQGNSGELIKLDASTTGGQGQYTTGDVIGCAIDFDNDRVDWYKNNTLTVSYTSAGLSSYAPLAPLIQGGGGSYEVNVNFGQRSFAYTPPSNHLAIVTTNLPDPLIADPSTAMDVVLYTGDGNSTQTITGLNFAPDLTWQKIRNTAGAHGLTDSVRGVSAGYLRSDSTAAETGSSANGVSAFTSDGFTAAGAFNTSGNNWVTWAWDAGTSTVSNTDGSITSQVRANPSAGFSIVTWTRSGGSNIATIGHGLNAVPELIILKDRDSTSNWYVGSPLLGTSPWGSYLALNSTAAFANNSDVFQQGGQPTSSVFGVGAVGNPSGNNLAYCFAPVDQYSSFGSFQGNGSADGPFVALSFRPRLVLAKRTDSTGDWILTDSARNTSNVVDELLKPNLSDATETYSQLDFLSNGFKVRNTGTNMNASGGTYIYIAFAEHPLSLNGGLAR